MIDLKKISRGKESHPPRVLVYSFEGVGKTRFASGAPDPFFLDFDRGSHQCNVARATPESWTETLEWLTAIEKGQVKCQTVVLDSITKLESISHAEFFPGTTVDAYDGGWGHGDTHALMRWRELLGQLERLWLRGIAVVLVAHASVKRFDDPSGPAYDRFVVGVRPSLAGLLRQQTDYVFFCREDVIMAGKIENGKGRATTTGTRWAYTRRTPAYDAKARGESVFPEKFLLSWDEFAKAVAGERARTEELNASIAAMLEELAEPDLTKRVYEWLRQNPENLLEAHQSVTARVETKRASGSAPVATATANGGA
jgi:hypothetical protein